MTPLVEKIGKLLLKAESPGVSPEEAATFFAKAEELMIRNAIERADALRAAGKTGRIKDPVVTLRMEFPVEYPRSYWSPLRQSAVDVLFATELVGVAQNNRGRYLVLYGPKTEVESLSRLVESLWRQAVSNLEIWKVTDPGYKDLSWSEDYNEKWACTKSYLRGFGCGFAVSIRDRREEVTDASTELVLRDRREEIQEAMTGIGKARSGKVKIGHGYAEGFEDGRVAEKGRSVETTAPAPEIGEPKPAPPPARRGSARRRSAAS